MGPKTADRQAFEALCFGLIRPTGRTTLAFASSSMERMIAARERYIWSSP
jgi:hypothetical protein